MGITKRLGLWSAAGLIALGGVGCGGERAADTAVEKLTERAVERALRAEGKDATVDIDAEGERFSMTVRGDDGEEYSFDVGHGGALPEGFPEDVPTYPGMEIVSSQRMPAQQMFMVQAKTSDGAGPVSAALKRDAEAQGWTEVMAMNMGPEHQMLTYEKDGRVLSINVMSDGGDTVLSITTAKND